MKYLQFIFLLLVFIACKPSVEQRKKPANFLTEEKMVEVIADFTITEAAVRQLTGYGHDSKVVSDYYYKKVLEKYNITPDDFQENLSYYSQNPKQIHDIYSRVVTRLSETQTEISTRK